MDIKNTIKDKFSKENLKPDTTKKKILLGVIALLLGALGLTATSNDFSLESILSGNSVSDSKIQTDSSGNLQQNDSGDFVTKVMRDKQGNVVPQGTAGAKYTNDYNCDDFQTQLEAQTFFEKAGGIKGDVNRLDGNKNGQACTSLPAGI